MSNFTLQDKYNVDRLNYLQKDFGYPECSTTPMTEEEIKSLKIGTTCYVLSNAGLRLAMFAYPDKGRDGEDDRIAFYTCNGTDKYKVKNVSKTYNVFRAYVN